MSKQQLVMIVRKTACWLAMFSSIGAWIALMLSGMTGAIAAFVILVLGLALAFATLDVLA